MEVSNIGAVRANSALSDGGLAQVNLGTVIVVEGNGRAVRKNISGLPEEIVEITPGLSDIQQDPINLTDNQTVSVISDDAARSIGYRSSSQSFNGANTATAGRLVSIVVS